ARARIQAAGLAPDEHLPAAEPPPEAPPTTLDEVELAITAARKEAEERRVEMTRKRAEAEAEAKKQREAAGIAEDERRGGPPKFSAAAELQKLRDMIEMAHNGGTRLPVLEAQVADPAFRKQLQKTEDGLREQYRRGAHFQPPAPSAEATLNE